MRKKRPRPAFSNQTSLQTGVLLEQDQEQGEQALSVATTQAAQAIGSATNQAAQQKTLLQLALDDSGREITADENRLQQSKAQELGASTQLLAGEQTQYNISSKNMVLKANAWHWQFNQQADADFDLYLKQLWAATGNIRQSIHSVLVGVSVVSTFVPVIGFPVGRLADAVNAALYLAEGNYLQAGLCSLTLVPLAGPLFSSASEGERVAEGIDQEAGQLALAGEEATGAAAANATQDAQEVDGAISREASEAQSGESDFEPNVESDGQALGNANDCGQPGGGCFPAGTEVETGTGGEEPIQDVKVGDTVMSRDQFNPNGPAQPEKVTAVYQYTVTDLRDVTIVSGGGSSETIRATPEHPFYVQGTGWVGALELTPGEQVEEPDGSWATVTANTDEPHPEGISVYNFQVDADHTYFVSQGGAWVWVHNTCVYVSRNSAGIVDYVGITDNPAARAAAHLRTKGIITKTVSGLSSLTRTEARSIEQVLIEKFGLPKTGGGPLNKINSIAPSNPIYSSSKALGTSILHSLSLFGF